MISVTVAAHGRSKRVVGAHLRAYGSGRLSICDLDHNLIEHPKDAQPRFYEKLFNKIVDIIWHFLFMCFPFIQDFFEHKRRVDVEESRLCLKNKSGKGQPISQINKLSDLLVLRILQHVDADTVVACESVCQKWRKLINANLQMFPKITKDQIRVLFDEGEIIIYPMDEKRCPVRYPMPSLQMLSLRLRHLSTLSLFVRGLIPVESCPVLRSLSTLSLRPQQIYFIWSKFSPQSIPLLEELLLRNESSVVDLGLEECQPAGMLGDALFLPLLPRLSSLRIWNDGKAGTHNLTDLTVDTLTRCIGSGQLETLDLASCRVTARSICELIAAWVAEPRTNLSISINYCAHASEAQMESLLREKGIVLRDGKLSVRGHCLSVFC